MRILIVEDQKKMSSFLQRGFGEAGYTADLAESGDSALALAAANDYDLVVLDVMMPGMNGFDTARTLRRDGFAGPVLMLTALGSTKDKVVGLDAGADDYMTKPFEFDELLARVRALLRRSHQRTSEPGLKYSDLEIDLRTRKVSRGGESLTLTPKEFSLLHYLMQNPDRPLTRTAIAEHVWDLHFDSESNVIDVYVNLLRKKLEQRGRPRLIHTVVGVGYVLREGEGTA